MASVNKYDDCMRVCTLSVASYGGQAGVLGLLKEDRDFAKAKEQMQKARATVQVMSLIQATYRDRVDPAQRSKLVSDTIGKVPTGAVPQVFLDLANSMLR